MLLKIITYILSLLLVVVGLCFLALPVAMIRSTLRGDETETTTTTATSILFGVIALIVIYMAIRAAFQMTNEKAKTIYNLTGVLCALFINIKTVKIAGDYMDASLIISTLIFISPFAIGVLISRTLNQALSKQSPFSAA